MVTKKKMAGSKKSAGKLKLKKETLRDLNLQKTSGQIKGGKKPGMNITCAYVNCITVSA